MLEIRCLVAEDVVDVEFVFMGQLYSVIEHSVMAGMALDDSAHSGDFVGVEDGFETARLFEDGGQRRGHTHKLVGDDDGRAFCGADGFERGDSRRGEADVLLIFPQVFILIALDAEPLEHLPFEFVSRVLIGTGYIYEQDLGRTFYTSVPVDEGPPAVDYIHVVGVFDVAEGVEVAGLDEAIDRRIEDFAVFAEAVFDRSFGREQGADENRTADRFEIGIAGEEALQDGSDAADFAHDFVGDMDNCCVASHTNSLQAVKGCLYSLFYGKYKK